MKMIWKWFEVSIFEMTFGLIISLIFEICESDHEKVWLQVKMWWFVGNGRCEIYLWQM